MPIYFDKFKLLNKLTFSLFKIYLNAKVLLNAKDLWRVKTKRRNKKWQ